MTVIDAYRTSLYSDDSLFVKDCNAWVTPVINDNAPTFIVYVEDTDTKKYTWHYFLYERMEDGTWDRGVIPSEVYEILRRKWVIYPQEIRH
jgi:hypothetical protein